VRCMDALLLSLRGSARDGTASANALAPDTYTVGAILDRRGDGRGPQL